MIQPNELRINNYLSYEDEIMKVTGLSKNHVYLDKLLISHKDEVEPILITEDELIKLGFKLIDVDSNYTSYKIDDIYTIQLDTKYNKFYLFNHLGKICGLKFIHNIQNLYFSLTNKELTYKN